MTYQVDKQEIMLVVEGLEVLQYKGSLLKNVKFGDFKW